MNQQPLFYKRRLRFSLIILISQLLLVALAIGWGINLILIAVHGGVYSVEANPLILYAEIATIFLIILFAFFVIYLEIVRMRSRRRTERDSQN